MDDKVKELEEKLQKAVLKAFGKEEKAGILFSGGIDSSLLAFLCKRAGKKVKLYSVFYENSHDKSQTMVASKALGLELNAKEYKKAEGAELFDDFREVSEKLNLRFTSYVMLSVKFSTFIAIKFAAENGEKLLLSGQGADELFAGYARYIKILEEKGEKELEKALRHDFEAIYAKIDEKIADFFGADIKFPYLEKSIVDFAFSLPVELKIRNKKRKFILYELAKELGIGREITGKEKKAMQYSSGFDKVLKKLLNS